MKEFLQCFTTSVSLRELDKFSSRGEMTRPNFYYITAVRGALQLPALIYN